MTIRFLQAKERLFPDWEAGAVVGFFLGLAPGATASFAQAPSDAAA